MSTATIAVKTGIPILDKAAKAFNDHNVDELARIWTDDAEISAPGGEQLRGGKDWAAYQSTFFTAFPDAQMEVHFSGQVGNAVIQEGTLHGTHTGPLVASDSLVLEATGKVIAHRYMEIFWVNAEGRVDKVHLYHDPAALYAHLDATDD